MAKKAKAADIAPGIYRLKTGSRVRVLAVKDGKVEGEMPMSGTPFSQTVAQFLASTDGLEAELAAAEQAEHERGHREREEQIAEEARKAAEHEAALAAEAKALAKKDKAAG